MARLTRLLIGINVAVFTLEAVSGQRFLATFALLAVGHFFLWPSSLARSASRWAADHVRLSSANFLHHGDQHVPRFGCSASESNELLGPRHYLTALFRFPCLVQRDSVVSRLNDGHSTVFIRTVGASARSSGIWLASACFFRVAPLSC